MLYRESWRSIRPRHLSLTYDNWRKTPKLWVPSSSFSQRVRCGREWTQSRSRTGSKSQTRLRIWRGASQGESRGSDANHRGDNPETTLCSYCQRSGVNIGKIQLACAREEVAEEVGMGQSRPDRS